jgi:hypothetical protein
MLKVICHTVNRSGNVNILQIKTPGTYIGLFTLLDPLVGNSPRQEQNVNILSLYLESWATPGISAS